MQTDTLTDIILPGLVNGETQLEIAAKAGCHNSTVSRWKDKLQDVLEAIQVKIIDRSAEDVVDNFSTTIGRAHSILHNPTIKNNKLSDYKDILQLSHKKEVLLGQVMGVLPSNTQPTQITNILNINAGSQAENVPRIQELIEARQQADVNVIDGEYEETEG